MQTVTLSAHVNGDRIQLDEPFAFPANARLLVTILPESPTDAERQEWYALSKAGLARAYADDEPDYPASLVRAPSRLPVNVDVGRQRRQRQQNERAT